MQPTPNTRFYVKHQRLTRWSIHKETRLKALWRIARDLVMAERFGREHHWSLHWRGSLLFVKNTHGRIIGKTKRTIEHDAVTEARAMLLAMCDHTSLREHKRLRAYHGRRKRNCSSIEETKEK